MEWNYWCEKSKVKVEYNKIQFGIKISQLIKKTINKNGEIIMMKDTKHSTTTIYIDKMKLFFKKLNKIDFIDDEEGDDDDD